MDLLKLPALMTGFCDFLPCQSWSIRRLAEIFTERKFPCRILKRGCGKTLETECDHLQISLPQFREWLDGCDTDSNPLAEYAQSMYSCYIDYNYIKDIFEDNPKMYDHVQWNSFGLDSFNGYDSTIWIGSEGANTPCHQDSYGFNLVNQIYGRKLWILFPPDDAPYLYPTRVPYEESSVFSNVNIRKPDLQAHPLIKSCHPVVVILHPGQTLYVPRHWFHYVESLEPSVSVNVWVPAQGDKESRYYEAITRVLACSLIKDLSLSVEEEGNISETMCQQDWLNPTEVITESSVNLSLLKTALCQYIEDKSLHSHIGPVNSANTTAATAAESMGRSSDSPAAGKSNYLHQFSSAMNDYPVTTVTSPFEFQNAGSALGKRGVEREVCRDLLAKRPRSGNDERFLTKQSDLNSQALTIDKHDAREVNKDADDLHVLNKSLRKVFSLESCSVDTYLDFLDNMCQMSRCPKCFIGPESIKSDASTTVQESHSQTLAHRYQGLSTDNKPRQAVESTSEDSAYNVNHAASESVMGNSLCDSSIHGQGMRPTSKGKEPAVTPTNITECGDSSEQLPPIKETMVSSVDTQNVDGDIPAPSDQGGAPTFQSFQSLTQKDVAEAFLASVLNPDIVQMMSQKLEEQCFAIIEKQKKT